MIIILKTAVTTLIIGKIIRAFGTVDMAQIIEGTGYASCLISFLILVTPFFNRMQQMTDDGAIKTIINLLTSR